MQHNFRFCTCDGVHSADVAHPAWKLQGVSNMLTDHKLVELARTFDVLVSGKQAIQAFPHLTDRPPGVQGIVSSSVTRVSFKLQRLACLQIPRFRRHDNDVLHVRVLNQHTIRATQRNFVTLDGFNDTRVRKWFLPCRPPPNRFCPGVSVDDLLTHFDLLVLPESVRQFRSLFRSGSIPTENLRSDLAIGLEDVLGMLADWFEIQNLKGLQLLFQRDRAAPPSINVPWREAMWPRRVVHQELYHREELCPLTRVAPKDIHQEHSQDLLQFLVTSLHYALLHRPPSRSKTLPHSHECSELLHQGVLKLDAAIAPQHLRYGAGPKDTPCEHSTHLSVRQVLAGFANDCVTQRANVTKHVPITSLVTLARSFHVHHHLFPAITVHRLNCHGVLLRRPFPKPDASHAPVNPLCHLLPGFGPPCDPVQDLHGLVG